MLLCAALKSNDKATHCPNASSLLKVRRTSRLEGKETFSGTLHAMLALHTVLSRTRRGSLPSAATMLSLPIAEPSGQRCATALRPAGKGLTQPLATSCSTNCCRRAGLRSACVQLPWQCSRWVPSRSSSSRSCCRCVHCMLDGMSSRMPAGTPCLRRSASCASGSCMRAAKACRRLPNRPG